jgi:hypothetical protein
VTGWRHWSTHVSLCVKRILVINVPAALSPEKKLPSWLPWSKKRLGFNIRFSSSLQTVQYYFIYTSFMSMFSVSSDQLFKPTHFLAAHVTILMLSSLLCIQTNYFSSYFFVRIYVPHRLWSWLFFQDLYYNISYYTGFILYHDLMYSTISCLRWK